MNWKEILDPAGEIRRLLPGRLKPRKYKKYEFCKDMHCSYLVLNKCVVNDWCNYTAKGFHKWLKENNFEILKIKE